MASKPVIGIDLGTTHSVVAVSRNGLVEIIANDQGNQRTPSCVAFTDTDRLVGEGALYQAHNNPENTIYAAKRLIGREFDDPDVQRDIKNWPFSVVEENNQIKIRVRYQGEHKTVYPEEISAAVLGKMRIRAEACLGIEINEAVITIPAYFNDTQRNATKTAAEIAGLKVVRLINEPTAAALAYADRIADPRRVRKNVLVFDFGATTLDVSILTMKGKEFKVRAVKGDTHLGGEDFDTRMVKYFTEEFKRQFEQDISKYNVMLRNLRTHCERAKRILSSLTSASFQLEGTSLKGMITRARFEDLCSDLFEKSIRLVDEALKDAEMSKEEVDDVLLISGSSRIPRVQELLQEFFNGKELLKAINPGECVAYGAAIQAALLQDDKAEQMKGLTLCDVHQSPLSLGVELHDSRMKRKIQHNSSVPFKHMEPLQETNDNICEDNRILDQFENGGIRSGTEDGEKVDISNANGILNVSADKQTTGVSETISIVNENCLNNYDTKHKEAQESRAQDELVKQSVDSRDSKWKRYLETMKQAMRARDELDEEDKKAVDLEFDQMISRLNANLGEAKDVDLTREEM